MIRPRSPGCLIAEVSVYFLPSRYIRVPQSGHCPSVAGRPFFIVTVLEFAIICSERHFMQYPIIASLLKP